MGSLGKLKSEIFEKYKTIPEYKRPERKQLRKVIKALEDYLTKYGDW